jgi:hypothetical protein
MYLMQAATPTTVPLSALKRACAIPDDAQDNEADLSALWHEQIAFIENNSDLILRDQEGTFSFGQPTLPFVADGIEYSSFRPSLRFADLSVESATYYNGEDTDLEVTWRRPDLMWETPSDIVPFGDSTFTIAVTLTGLSLDPFIDPLSRIIALKYLRSDNPNLEASIAAIYKSISVGL